MCAETKITRPNFFWSLFFQKCPRCRTGDMFRTRRPYDLKRFMKMNERCPVCGQRMEIEIGFYYGTSYISYALTVALMAWEWLYSLMDRAVSLVMVFLVTHMGLMSCSWSQTLMCFHDTHQLSD